MKKNELDRLNSKIQQKSTFVQSLRESISEVIVGQNDLIDKILIFLNLNLQKTKSTKVKLLL